MDDLISRQAAIDLANELYQGMDIVQATYNEVRKAIVAFINLVPSAQPMRKRGEWMNHRNDMGHNIADCSECGEAMQWYDPDTRPNYCPNCGCRMMRGDADE